MGAEKTLSEEETKSQTHLGTCRGWEVVYRGPNSRLSSSVYRRQTSVLPTSQRGQGKIGWPCLHKTSLTGSTEQPRACSTYLTLKRKGQKGGQEQSLNTPLFLQVSSASKDPKPLSTANSTSPTRTCALPLVSQA